ncbi:D-alanyl-D-alanine carboxypeptidase family protein [Paeniglutamicibacter kerguelensis]|uniref:LAS superfamily LD-carboxypeptidase LdcB n=1 Tax=Paeniglutamicibacter kerguelensis TaxID=254788 RepID=A0ABS4XAL9_9MICC|nr:D-alanyl-D-alanine carboxypeptidase family protein [Paeniglutamicibacter kerguelensis]MBP2385517.1 LAS superfamily LD-carboxypeptidase LdcB [Paeniglutamicibacter kerguelensis]
MRKHLKIPALLATATLSLTMGFAAAPASASASAQSLAPASLTLTPQLAKKPAPPRNPKKFNVLVNKTYPLAPKTYAPKTTTIPGTNGIRLQTTTATAYKKLAAAAKKDGVKIKLTSGYRSYSSQKKIVDQYTRWYGPTKALSLAAKPGTSEHQTGLSLDVGNFNKACALQDCFENTPVGKWMAKNAPKYGFVLRYPKGQQNVTGYSYEPWHFRYVGTTQARTMAKKKSKTLEHYYGVASTPKTTTKPVTSVKPSTKTATQNVNLRKSATTASESLTVVKKSTKVRLTGKASGVWVQVKVGTRTGWMSSQYLR